MASPVITSHTAANAKEIWEAEKTGKKKEKHENIYLTNIYQASINVSAEHGA